MLAHVPSFGRNPRGSPDFLAYLVLKACMHVLGTGVPRRSGVQRSASSPKAAQALGCSLSPGLRISFGRVTCMARVASVPGLWTLGFLLLCGVCVRVRVVFGLGFRLHSGTPGWGEGVCVCLCARSACTPPLLAGVCGVGLCPWARVSAAPRYSWLGCWRVCVFVCPLLLHPATPGWGVWCGCVCLGSRFGCSPPLLAGVLGCVCVGVRAPLVPRHSWLGCAVWVCVLGLGVWLRPASPGWGVGVCVCSCARSACMPLLLAGVVGVGVSASAQVSAAPRHSRLGCFCLRVCVRAPLVPRHSGWDVRRGCVCLGLGFCCASPLLAGALGCVCVCVPAPLVPRDSWLGCAAWVCVLRLGFRLRPATAGWGVRVYVCLCALPACTPPLLAGVCGVGVCASARVSAALRHSWPGCWGVCVFVCAPRLYPATPGWGVRRGCVCSGSGFGCSPPLLAGVFGCLCVSVPAPLVPCHSWLGCPPWVCVLRLGFRLRPATPGWGVGSCACSCARSACTPPLLAGVCGVGVCALAWVSAAPRHSWLGCWCACVLVFPLRLHPATPGTGVWCGCVYLGWGLGCAPPLLAGVLGCVCVLVRAPLVPRHSWLGCVAWVCVWARVSAAPRHSWLGCWGGCVFVCPLRLYPATPGWGVRRGCVCLGSGFGCAPPLLARVLACVCVRVPALLVPRQSWLGCVVSVCVFGLGSRLRAATPGWGVGVCVCFCARSACTPPLLAGVCSVGVCALACIWVCPATPGWGVGLCVSSRVPAPLVPRHSLLGCVVWMCVFWLGFRLRPATPCWGDGSCACSCARSACSPPLLAGLCGLGVCLGSGFGCSPHRVPGVLGCVCGCVPAPLVPRHSWLGCSAWVCVLGLGFRLRPATPGWGVGLCVCSCARSACSPPLLAGVCGVSVCVLGLGFRLRPATPGWGVGVCVCSCPRSACTPPLLAGVCGVGVCACARVSVAPRHSWLGCVCVPVPVPLVPRLSQLGCVVWVCVLGLGFRLRPATPGWGVGPGCVFVCALRLYPATPGWGLWGVG